ILINGTTTFDATNDAGAATLNSIEQFWTSGGTFVSRVTALRNMTVTSVTVPLNATTITNDTSIDTLNAGAGQYWFFYKTTNPAMDIVNGLNPAIDAVN